MSATRKPELNGESTADSRTEDPSAVNDGATDLSGRSTLFRLGASRNAAKHPGWVILPDAHPANDESIDDPDAWLAADPEFDAICDARRESWMAAMEADAEQPEQPLNVTDRSVEEGQDDECK
jgi:hypothetical protein